MALALAIITGQNFTNRKYYKMSTLRKYQETDKSNIYKAWKEVNSVLYQLPMGGGKSVILSSIIEDHKDEQIIVFAHKRKLLHQLKGHLNSRGIRCGLLMGMTEEDLDSNIVVVSIKTAVKDARLEKLLKRNPNRVFIDEARHSRTGSYDKVLIEIKAANPNVKLLGVDGTPYRKDKKRLDFHFDVLIQSEEDIASLTEKGFLQKCKTIVCPIERRNLDAEVKEVANDYQLTALSHYMRKPKFLANVVEQYITYGEGRQNIVFAVDKAHARDLQQTFEDNGFEGKVARIDSSMTEKEIEQVYNDFISHKIQHLINVEMITEGVDLPDAGCITGARPTKSLTLYMQAAARGGRPDGVHDYFILLDCCGWTEEYGTISSPKQWSLNPEIDPNGKRLTHKVIGRRANGELEEDLEDFIGEVIEMSPEEYLKNLAGGKEKAELINLSLDDKIDSLVKDMLLPFKRVMDANAIEERYDLKYEFWERNKQITFTWTRKGAERHWRQNSFKMTIRCAIDGKSSVETYNTNSDNPIELYQLYSAVGTLGIALEEKKEKGVIKHIEEILEEVFVLENQKISIREFEKAEEQLKEDQWLASVQEHAKLHQVFKCAEPLVWSSVFSRDYKDDAIVAIEIPSGRINNHHNSLKLHTCRRMWDSEQRKYVVKEESLCIDEKNYIKGEKVLEMIKDAKWNEQISA